MKLTKHATNRIKERIGIPKSSAEKMGNLALTKGICHNQTSGSFRKYFDFLYLSHGNANNVRVYGEMVYLFNNETLITVFPLPNEYKKIIKKIKNALQG
jgi:hypothetical protein